MRFFPDISKSLAPRHCPLSRPSFKVGAGAPSLNPPLKGAAAPRRRLPLAGFSRAGRVFRCCQRQPPALRYTVPARNAAAFRKRGSSLALLTRVACGRHCGRQPPCALPYQRRRSRRHFAAFARFVRRARWRSLAHYAANAAWRRRDGTLRLVARAQ